MINYLNIDTTTALVLHTRGIIQYFTRVLVCIETTTRLHFTVHFRQLPSITTMLMERKCETLLLVFVYFKYPSLIQESCRTVFTTSRMK